MYQVADKEFLVMDNEIRWDRAMERSYIYDPVNSNYLSLDDIVNVAHTLIQYKVTLIVDGRVFLERING